MDYIQQTIESKSKNVNGYITYAYDDKLYKILFNNNKITNRYRILYNGKYSNYLYLNDKFIKLLNENINKNNLDAEIIIKEHKTPLYLKEIDGVKIQTIKNNKKDNILRIHVNTLIDMKTFKIINEKNTLETIEKTKKNMSIIINYLRKYGFEPTDICSWSPQEIRNKGIFKDKPICRKIL